MQASAISRHFRERPLAIQFVRIGEDDPVSKLTLGDILQRLASYGDNGRADLEAVKVIVAECLRRRIKEARLQLDEAG